MIIPTSFAQATWTFDFVGGARPAAVTHGFNVSGYSGSPTEAAETLKDIWVEEWAGIQTSALFLQSVLVKFGPNSTGPSGEWTGAVQMSVPGDPEPPNTAFLLHKHTPYGGRSGRGRMYIPGPPAAAVLSGGLIETAYLGGLQDRADAFYLACIDANLDPVLLHGEDSPAEGPYVLTGYTADGIAATQRRRLRR